VPNCLVFRNIPTPIVPAGVACVSVEGVGQM